MTQPLIACVGHCAIDHVFHIDQFPDRATKTPARSFNSVGGGMAANAAMALVSAISSTTWAMPWPLRPCQAMRCLTDVTLCWSTLAGQRVHAQHWSGRVEPITCRCLTPTSRPARTWMR